MELLKQVKSGIHSTRDIKTKSLKKSGIKNLREGYKPSKTTSQDFWRMRKMLRKIDNGYNSDTDPDYEPGMEVEQVTRPGMDSDTPEDTSFASTAVSNRSGRSRRSKLAACRSTVGPTPSTGSVCPTGSRRSPRPRS